MKLHYLEETYILLYIIYLVIVINNTTFVIDYKIFAINNIDQIFNFYLLEFHILVIFFFFTFLNLILPLCSIVPNVYKVKSQSLSNVGHTMDT